MKRHRLFILALVLLIVAVPAFAVFNERNLDQTLSVLRQELKVDYDKMAGSTIKVVCTLDPHSYVMEIAKEILAEKNITLEYTIVDDYVTPNTMVDAGDVYANYFAHEPYQTNFNAENGTHLNTVCFVHVEPMAMFGGKQASLDALK